MKKSELNTISKHTPKNIKLKTIGSNNNLIKKIRYVDEYNSARLFQSNENEKDTLTIKETNKVCNFLKKNKEN